MKRFWAIILTLCMLFTQENLMVLAATMDNGEVVKLNATTGTLGENNGFQWTYDVTTKTLTVTGEDSDLVPLEFVNSPFLQIDSQMEKIVFKDCVFRGSLRYLMNGLTNLLDVEFDNCDTSEVTDMSGMFYECSSLGTLDVSSFDTSNVTDMSFMFTACRNLTDLDVSTFDTSNVTSMMHMFSYCTNLKDLNISGFETGNVESMSCMFTGCEKLTSLNLSHFRTSQVTSMNAMFDMCVMLENLDLSSFDTSNVTDMGLMFRNCSNLKTVNVSGFDTSNVTNMDFMFYSCYEIKELDLSSFDMSNVTSSNEMLTLVQGIAFDKILTPKAIAEGISIQLPGTYRDANGNIVTALTFKNCNTVLTEMIAFEDAGVTINLSEYSYTYTGKACEPVVEFIVDGVVLKKDIDYTVSYKNNIDVGTATVIVTGKGNYLGTASCEYTITKASISKAKVTLSTTSYNYNGKKKTPKVTVKFGNKTLKSGTDYTVTYQNNKNIGTATVTIKGKGNYTGTITEKFTIKAKKDATFTYKNYKYKVTSSSAVAFIGIDTKKAGAKISIPKTVKYGGKTFKVTAVASKALKGNKKITQVTVGDNVTSIGISAFAGCTKLSKVTIGKKVKTIGASAFEDCKKLSKVTIGSAVTTIDKKAFKSCTALTSITIPSKVAKINKQAFYGCKSLKTITIKSTKLTKVEKEAFKKIKSNVTIKVPKKKYSDYTKLLQKSGVGSKVKFVKIK